MVQLRFDFDAEERAKRIADFRQVLRDFERSYEDQLRRTLYRQQMRITVTMPRRTGIITSIA